MVQIGAKYDKKKDALIVVIARSVEAPRVRVITISKRTGIDISMKPRKELINR